MKTGTQLIADERIEQIAKHGRTVEQDVEINSGFEKPLTKAAAALTVEYGNALAAEAMKPEGWNIEIWKKMMAKPYKERLVIAGALIAAEIDRLDYINNSGNIAYDAPPSEFTYDNLLESILKLNPEQRKTQVYSVGEEDYAIINGLNIVEEDIYCNTSNDEDRGTLKELKELHGEDFVEEDYILSVPTGRPFMSEDF